MTTKKKTIIKQCVECGVKESDSLKLVSIILPPTITKRMNVCRSCLSTLIDNDISKNKEKAERVK